MKKKDFKELLTDLYTAYNPEYLMYVDSLVEKYHGGMEFNAVEMVMVKYNHKDYAHYDPEKSTDEYILQLIKDYSSEKRTLKGFTVEMQIARNKELSEEEKVKQAQLEAAAKKEAEKELSGVKSKISQTERKIDEAQKKLDKKLSEINKQLEEADKGQPIIQKTSFFEDVEIKIRVNYTDSELVLPNKSVFAGLGKDSRIVVQDTSGRVVGLVIEDILYDCISHPAGKPILEITINKG